jgi:hypothetical protein
MWEQNDRIKKIRFSFLTVYSIPLCELYFYLKCYCYRSKLLITKENLETRLGGTCL